MSPASSIFYHFLEEKTGATNSKGLRRFRGLTNHEWGLNEAERSCSIATKGGLE